MGLLDRLFGRRGQRGSGDRFTRDDSYQYVQPPPTDQSGGHGESHHQAGQEPGGQHDQSPGQQDQAPGSQDPQSQDPAEYDVQSGGDAGGGDGGGGGDSGGGGDGGGGGNGGGGGD
jgi:hypothetical protein